MNNSLLQINSQGQVVILQTNPKNIAFAVGCKIDLSVNVVIVLIISIETTNLLFGTYHVTHTSRHI